MTNREKPVLNKNFELADNTLIRQLRHKRRTARLLRGQDKQAPRLKHFVTLFYYHYLGRTHYFLQTRWHQLKQWIKHV